MENKGRILGIAVVLVSLTATFMFFTLWQLDINTIPQEITINNSNISGILKQNLTVNTSGFEMCSYELPAISNPRVCRQICEKGNLTGTFTVIAVNETNPCPFWCVCKEMI